MANYSIPLSVPCINGNEMAYVKECIDTEWVSSAGKYVNIFEKSIAKYTNVKYAIACVNGTSALQLSLQLSGVKPGDEVIVPTLTFIASINAINYNGANPIFMDVDNYYNINIDKTIEFINKHTIYKNGFTLNKQTGKRISAIMPVHVWGNAANLEKITSLCSKLNIAVIEDASESLGTFYKFGKFKNKHTGTIGKIGCLSFNGNKIITTGGGGMILTNDSSLAEKAKYLTTQAKDDPIKYIHNEVGYNFRLTNIQAALGVAQLEKLPEFLKNKKEIYQLYVNEINKIEGLQIAEVPNYANNNHWMNILKIDSKIYSKDRDLTMKILEQNGVQSRPVWWLNHKQDPYKNSQTFKIDKAEKLLIKSLCLPSSSNLRNNDVDKIIGILNG